MRPQILSAERKEMLSQKKDSHLDTARKFKMALQSTIEKSLGIDKHVEVLTFALQRSFETPSLKNANDVYFKRPLWTFSFCIYDEIRNKAHFYVWNETVAANGTQEIASCIYRYIDEVVPKETREIILISESQFGLNRNAKMALMLKWMVYRLNLNDLESIEQRFFSPGHTKNKCDRSFIRIEDERRKLEDLYVPGDWMDLIKKSKTSHPEFKVTEMNHNHFFSSEILEKLIDSKKLMADGKKIKWHEFRTIKYNKSDHNPFKFMATGDSSSEFELKRTAPINFNLFRSIKLDLLYPDGRAISKQKYDDLLSLLNYIPSDHHNFYKTLKHTQSSVKDYALASRQSSDDEE